MKYLIPILCSAFLCIAVSCAAQQDTTGVPETYELAGKKLVFEDNFDRDSHNWLKPEPGTNKTGFFKNTTVKDGLLQYVNGNRGIFAAKATTDIDFNQDFEMEYRAKLVYTSDDRGIADVFYWGRDSLNNTIYLYRTINGTFLLIDCTRNSGNDFVIHESAATGANTDDFNIITIRHKGDYFYLFLNKKYQGKFPFIPVKGHAIGLGAAGKKSAMQYDYVRIYTL